MDAEEYDFTDMYESGSSPRSVAQPPSDIPHLSSEGRKSVSFNNGPSSSSSTSSSLCVKDSDREDFSQSTQTRLRRQSSADQGFSPVPVDTAADKFKAIGEDEEDQEDYKISPRDFELLTVIGKGAYGRVLQVRETRSGQIYAMKVLQKGQVLQKNNLEYVREERNILSQAEHPFVVSLMCAFQTQDKLYLVMEYVCGGELFSHLRNEGLFDEKQTRFYAGEIILAIEYLHRNGIIHRDLKPENVLLDERGHLRITDFGLAKIDRENKKEARTLCGTDLYMAPEMLACKSSSQGYGKAVDFWSLGVIVFEMLTGDTPFYARDTQKLYKMILTQKPKFPRWLSAVCVSLLKGLLNKNVSQRLGAAESTMFKTGGVAELKSHEFFKGLDWNMLERCEIDPPIRPTLANGLEDTSNFSKNFTELEPRDVDDGQEDRYKSHLDTAQPDDFKGFSFTRSSYLETTMSARKERKQADHSSREPLLGESEDEGDEVRDIPAAPSSASSCTSKPASTASSTSSSLSSASLASSTVSGEGYFVAESVGVNKAVSSKPSGLRSIKPSKAIPTQDQDTAPPSTVSTSAASVNNGGDEGKQIPALNPNAKEWVPSWMK